MQIRTENEIKEFNAALDKCSRSVWLMGPSGDCFDLKNAEEYGRGMAKLMESDDNQYGIFTASFEDEMIMMDICRRMAA